MGKAERDAEIAARTEAEMRKGGSMVIHDVIAQRFDPEYQHNPGIDPEDRARRDDYKRRMIRGRGEDPKDYGL